MDAVGWWSLRSFSGGSRSVPGPTCVDVRGPSDVALPGVEAGDVPGRSRGVFQRDGEWIGACSVAYTWDENTLSTRTCW